MNEEIQESGGAELSDQQMDDLVSRSENASNRSPEMVEKPEAERAAPEVPAQTPIEFKHNGKTVKATTEQLIKWAQMGIDYPQKAQALNFQKQQWELDRQKYEQQYAPYRQIDEWAGKNPDQWKALVQMWNQGNFQPNANPAQGQSGQHDPYAAKFQQMEGLLNQVLPQVQQVLSERQEEKNRADDTKLDQEIQDLRSKYQDMDFDQIDDSGKSLESRILEHAVNNGIKNFGTAFKDYCHDMLIARAEALAKQAVSRGIQNNSKLGILGKSPSPKRGLSEATDIKNKNYDDLAKEALNELRAG